MKIKCVALTTDGQDGSYCVRVFSDKESMLAHFRLGTSVEEVSDEEFFNEDDPYENGYIDLDVEIDIDIDNCKLNKPFTISAG